MTFIRMSALGCLFSCAFLSAAETPAAEFTRSRRLAVKVTLSIQNQPLKTALEAFSNQLEASKFGRLRFEIAPTAAPMVPATVSLDVKDQALGEALNKLLNPTGLGFTVISSEIDPKDGWVRIIKQDKPAEAMKPVGPPATQEEERDAKLKLDTARQAIADGRAADAKFLLNFILKKYPTASAAAEAKTLLESLK